MGRCPHCCGLDGQNHSVGFDCRALLAASSPEGANLFAAREEDRRAGLEEAREAYVSYCEGHLDALILAARRQVDAEHEIDRGRAEQAARRLLAEAVREACARVAEEDSLGVGHAWEDGYRTARRCAGRDVRALDLSALVNGRGEG